MGFLTLPRNTHFSPFHVTDKTKSFIWGEFKMSSIMFKGDHVLEPGPTFGAHSCAAWEYLLAQ